MADSSNGKVSNKRARSEVGGGEEVEGSKRVKVEESEGEVQAVKVKAENNQTTLESSGQADNPESVDEKGLGSQEPDSIQLQGNSSTGERITSSKTNNSRNMSASDSKPAPVASDAQVPDASTSTSNPNSSSESSNQNQSSASVPTAIPNVSMRALIVTQDASIIIGKQGRHVNEIRDKSGARITISEALPGNPERVLNVQGPLDAVSKAYGLIVRRINDEPFDVPSVPGSKAVTIRFIIPNNRMGSVIGKQGSKIKEIQDASGARLQASEVMLPGSTERILSVSGVADAIHIAVYYIGAIVAEPATTSNTGGGGRHSESSHTTYRPSGSSHSYRQQSSQSSYYPNNNSNSSNSNVPSYSALAAQPGSQTQQIFIPNDLVGCIIGKGGSKINEIRQASNSHIKILEPGEKVDGGIQGNLGERLVTITGQPQNIQMAISMLYQRLEQEKQKQMQGGM